MLWPQSGPPRSIRKARGGSLESEETALRRGRLDIALASVLSDAGLRISEAASLRWRDVLDAEDGAGLVYIERSKTDQAGEGAYVVVTPDTWRHSGSCDRPPGHGVTKRWCLDSRCLR